MNLSGARPIIPALSRHCSGARLYASTAVAKDAVSSPIKSLTSHQHRHPQRRWRSYSSTLPNLQSSSPLYENVSDDVDYRKKNIIINPGGSHKSKKKQRKKTKPPPSERPFVDRINLKTRGGTGGSGCISYHRIGSYKKKPSGGHGGAGGSVYLVTDPTLSSLKMEKHHFFGQDGGKGGVNAMQGKKGKDCYVRVPCGVVVRRVLDWDEMYGDAEDEHDEEDDIHTSDVADGDDVSLSLSNTTNDGGISLNLPGNANQSEAISDLTGDEKSGNHDAASEELDANQEDDTNHESDEADENDENDMQEEEEEEDFDAYYARLQSSKRLRKSSKKRRGHTPSDYGEVVDQEIRAEDGMYYWSTPEPINFEDDSMASTAFPDHEEMSMVRKSVFVADLDKPNTSLLVAAGGKAGVGNVAYANRPFFSNMNANAAKKSKPDLGDVAYLELELKLIADVGLVGFPNAGKSSLLSAMSRARPKIASYPFTTLHPLVGSIQYRDGYNIVMADVPGLIDGAAEGRGKGIEFLRHIERTKALVYMVDVAGVDGRDPINDLRILGKELKEYGSSGIFGENEMGGDDGPDGEEMRRRRREIMERPSLILANKMDLISEVDAQMGRKEDLLLQLGLVAEEVGIVCDQNDIMGISAGVTGEGLRVLSKRLRQVVKEVDGS